MPNPVTWGDEFRAYFRSVRHFEKPIRGTLRCLRVWAERVRPRMRGVLYAFAAADVERAFKSYPVWDLDKHITFGKQKDGEP